MDLRIINGLVTVIDDNGRAVYSLPDSDGFVGQSLKTDGAGNLTFKSSLVGGIQIKTADGTIVAILDGTLEV